MDGKHRIFLNSALSATSLLVSTAVAFLLTPVIVHGLGNRDYGIWETLMALVGYMGILDLGLGPALVRFFAFANAREEPESVDRIFSTSIAVLFGVGLAALMGLAAFATSPEWLLNLEKGSAPHLGMVLLLLGVNLLIRFPGTSLTAFFLGVQRHYVVYGVRSVLSIFQALLIWLAFTSWEGPKLVWLASIVLGVSVVEYAFCALLLNGRHGNPRFSVSHCSWSTLVELYGFAARNLLAIAGKQLTMLAMPLVVAHAVGIEWVVFYVLAFRLGNQALDFAIAVGQPLTPYFSGLHSLNDADQMRTDWFRATRFLQFLICGSAVGLAFLGTAFVGRWMGTDYADTCGNLILWMSVALFSNGLAPSAHSLLVGMGRHGPSGALWLASALGSVALAVPLGDRFALDGVGFAFAAGAMVCAAGLVVLGCRAVGVTIRRHLSAGLGALLLPLAIEASSLLALRAVWGEPVHYRGIFAHALAAGSAYSLAWYLLTLNHDDRRVLRKASQSLRLRR